MNCPKCGTKLQKDTAAKYRDHGGYKVIGNYRYCPADNCNYDTKISNEKKQ